MSSTALLAEFVGHAVADAGLHAGAGQPAGEAVGIVVAALGALLEHRHAAELGAPDDERVLEQAALLEVADQRGGGLIEDRGMHVVLLLELVVAVPVQLAAAGVGAVEELHEAHAASRSAAGRGCSSGRTPPWSDSIHRPHRRASGCAPARVPRSLISGTLSCIRAASS